MPVPNLVRKLLYGLAVIGLLGACAPKIGSDAWCQDMEEKPKGDWSTNEATAYTRHCILNMKPDE
jgi:hypothetical protein